jgi:hypothetical protein
LFSALIRFSATAAKFSTGLGLHNLLAARADRIFSASLRESDEDYRINPLKSRRIDASSKWTPLTPFRLSGNPQAVGRQSTEKSPLWRRSSSNGAGKRHLQQENYGKKNPSRGGLLHENEKLRSLKMLLYSQKMRKTKQKNKKKVHVMKVTSSQSQDASP